MTVDRATSPAVQQESEQLLFVTTPEPPALAPEALARLIARSTAIVGSDALLLGTRTANYLVEGRLPSLVALPGTPTQVASLLALAGEVGAAVTPWGGGTQMGIGYPLRRLDVVISLERLTTVIPSSPADHEVTVQAGSTIAALNAALAPQGQFVALDGPLSAHATVGGRLATGTVGLRRGRYGHVRDLVTNLVIARSDGVLMHTGGEVARNMLYHTLGYDLNNLYVGSLGALGVIVQATLRTAPLPEAESTVIASFDDVGILWELLEDLEAAELLPAAVDGVWARRAGRRPWADGGTSRSVATSGASPAAGAAGERSTNPPPPSADGL